MSKFCSTDARADRFVNEEERDDDDDDDDDDENDDERDGFEYAPHSQ
jgi:hypothetical protein